MFSAVRLHSACCYVFFVYFSIFWPKLGHVVVISWLAQMFSWELYQSHVCTELLSVGYSVFSGLMRVCMWVCVRMAGVDARVVFTVARLPDSPTVGHLWTQRWLFASQHSLICNHKVQMTPPAARSLPRARLKPHGLICHRRKKIH